MLAVATDETIDRHGESLSIDAWDLKNFKKNPVLQWAHDYYSPPVGLAKSIKRDGEKLVFEPVFHEFTQHAREIKKLYEEGIMTAFSVGFIPHYEGQGENQKVKLELLEISAVPIPANPAAIVIEKSIKEMTEEDKNKINKWVENEVEAETKVWDEIDNEIRYRIKDPDLFEDDSFRTIKIKKDKPRINGIIGKLKGEDTTTLQSLRFPKDDDWTLEEAKQWVKDHPDVGKTVYVDIEEMETEQKAGRVLSKKNRTTIEAAMAALQGILDADSASEDNKNNVEPQILKIQNEIEKTNKGRSQELILKETLEALNNQIGFIVRKIKKIEK